MDITSREYKRVTVVRVAGRVDAKTAKQFEDSVQMHINQGPPYIILEMDETVYLSSAGVRVLITAQKALKSRGGGVLIAQPSARVKEVLTMAGMDALFPVFEDTVAAIGSV